VQFGVTLYFSCFHLYALGVILSLLTCLFVVVYLDIRSASSAHIADRQLEDFEKHETMKKKTHIMGSMLTTIWDFHVRPLAVAE
jgi:hypothetical protein